MRYPASTETGGPARHEGRISGLLAEGPRRRLVLLLAAALVVVIALVALRSGSDRAPPTGAAGLVPSDALVYLHISTDGNRDAVQRTLALARRFPSYPRLRDGLLARLPSGGRPLSYQRDLAPWIGREVGVAVLKASARTTVSLVVVAVADRSRAERFLRQARTGTSTTYRGTSVTGYAGGASAFVGRYLVLGQQTAVRAAIDRSAGRAPGLTTNPAFRQGRRGMPATRVADVYVSPAGVREVLASRGGVLGIAGALLDQPALAGASIALSPAAGGARIRVTAVRDPAREKGLPPVFAAFSPRLTDAVPRTAMAYLGVTGLDRAAGRLLGLTAILPTGAQIRSLLLSRGPQVLRSGGVNLERDVLPLFRNEVALWLAPSLPSPYLTVIARTDDEEQTRVALARLQAPLTQLFTAPEAGPGQAPTFEERNVGGTKAFSLVLSPGVEIDYAVFDGKLVVSSNLEGIRRVKEAMGPLTDTDPYRTTLGGRPSKVTSLVFLDLTQLLGLGERTGLNASRGYLAVRDDLKRVRALGAATSGEGNQSTTELLLDIP